MARTNDLTDVVTCLQVMEVDKVLRGKSFSITGHLSKPRHEIVALIEQAGGRFDSTPSYGTTFLVTNADWTPGSTVGSKSSKFEKAQRMGLKIISEQRLLDMLSAPASGDKPV